MEREDENVEFILKNNLKHSSDEKFVWTPLLRQLRIASGIWTIYFLNGVIIGTPTVVIPQLRRELNSTTKFNEDFSPWLSSVFGIGGIPWVFILPALLEVVGRKFTFIVISVITLIGYIVLYCSSTVVQILISELILGILITASQTSVAVILTEYTAPKYRGLFLTFKSASFLWGIWVANAIGTFFHWKNIGLLASVLCFYTLTALVWPESPYWLASKGKFEECSSAHRWLKGTDHESERELSKLIESQTHTSNMLAAKNSFATRNIFIKFRRMIVLPEFYKPTLLSMLILIQSYVSGKLVCTMYAIEIVKKMTNSETAAYKTMLIIDGITVASAYIGSISSKFLRRKYLMISTTLVAILFLFMLSLYLYLVKLSVLTENNVISISLLTLYSMAISSGVMILVSSLIGEMLPLRFKCWTILVLSLFVNTIHFSTLRLGPAIISLLDLHGAFLFYSIGSCISLYLVYIYLPETKDKTLQEIEDGFKGLSGKVQEMKQFNICDHVS